MGAKSKHPLLKLQHYDVSESLETFLLKFQHLAACLQWNKEDRFHHLCANLDGPASQVIMDFSRGNIKFVRDQTVLSGLT